METPEPRRASSRTPKPRLAFALLLAAIIPTISHAQSSDITQLSLEQLSQAHISISSFGRKDEDLWQTPAAVFVITREDIEQSSASALPELLRMVPGVQVAQLTASTWAISVRGFNSAFSNKLLVLVDGRSVYSEIFSGTQWDQIDLPLDNVERIEVIRGPGAVVWGANAVNGVINIITRHPRATQGLLVTTSGSRLENSTLLRFGGTAGDRIQYTASASYLNRAPLVTASGGQAFDGADTFRGNAVLDWNRNPANTFTLDSDYYTGRLKQQILEAIALDFGPNHQEHQTFAGGHILGRWQHKSPSASDLALEIYFDDQSRYQLTNHVATRTLAADVQDHLNPSHRNDIVVGAELRLTQDTFNGAILINRLPQYRHYLADAFLQDEITLLPRRLTLTLGSKIENGSLAGFQLQPSARILFAPSQAQSFWAAISRAVVAPSLQDTQLTLPVQFGQVNGIPFIGQFIGDPAFRPEKVLAYEAGSRTRLGQSLSLDLAAFYNSNTRIQSLSAGAPFLTIGPVPDYFVTLLYTNGFQARTGGVEASIAWKPRPNLSFQTSYAWLQSHTTQLLPGFVFLVDAWNTPHHTLSESASWAVSPRWSLSGFYSYSGWLPPATGVLSIDTQGGTSTFTPAYNRLDLHLSRKLPHSFGLEAGGTNLLTPRHLEFGSATSFDLSAYIPRSAAFKLSWSH